MKKNIIVDFSETSGGITSISCVGDADKMNWCKSTSDFGVIHNSQVSNVCCDASSVKAVYHTNKLDVSVSRVLKNGILSETYLFVNNTDSDIFIRRGELAIITPFADEYESADVCMAHRCNTHIWCGGNTSYIFAEKMGEADCAVGLVLKKGSLDSYSTGLWEEKNTSNNRCGFALHPEPFDLRPGESYLVEWDIFACENEKDFYDIIDGYDNILLVSSDCFSVFENELINFSFSKNVCEITLDGSPISLLVKAVSYTPKRLGEHVFNIKYGDFKTVAKFFVSPDIQKLTAERVHFIVNNQQFHNPKSRLDGAYLIYDNEEERMYFGNDYNDHNASRERIGMGLLIANWLRTHDDKAVYDSLMKYVGFIYREIYDSSTGCVYNTVGYTTKRLRLYNAPWVAEFFTELYWLTDDKQYLEDMFKAECWFYENGGGRFYPNATFINNFVEALNHANMKDKAESLISLYIAHAENMISIGTSYPKHEVNFEQTIVAPAVTHLQNLTMITGDERFLEESESHLEILNRFNGHQPDYRLYETSIRHWDGFWFGKRRLYGDTFPHYWSSLNGVAYLERYKLTGDKVYLAKAKASMKACLCLFTPDGRGSCAYLYPFSSNNARGEYYDPWANDQDFALYYNYKYLKEN